MALINRVPAVVGNQNIVHKIPIHLPLSTFAFSQTAPVGCDDIAVKNIRRPVNRLVCTISRLVYEGES